MLTGLSITNSALINFGVILPDEEVVGEALLIHQKQI